MSVLTLHPVPLNLKEALGRAVGNEVKRRGRSRREGAGWNREKAGTHRRGALYPACTCSVPEWWMPALFPPSTTASSLPSRLWVVAQDLQRQRVVLGGSGAWARGLCVPELRPRLLPAPPPPWPAGRRRGVRARLGTVGDARAAASLRRSRRAEAVVAADPRGLAVGGTREPRRASPDKCFLCEAAAAASAL